MILVAQNVREDSVVGTLVLTDETHGDTRDRLLHLDTSITQSERTSADRSHRGRAVGLKDITHHTDHVGVVLGDHALERTVCEVTVADLTTADAARSFCLACGEWREVVVQEEALLAVVEYVVDQLLIALCTERHCG